MRGSRPSEIRECALYLPNATAKFKRVFSVKTLHKNNHKCFSLAQLIKLNAQHPVDCEGDALAGTDGCFLCH